MQRMPHRLSRGGCASPWGSAVLFLSYAHACVALVKPGPLGWVAPMRLGFDKGVGGLACRRPPLLSGAGRPAARGFASTVRCQEETWWLGPGQPISRGQAGPASPLDGRLPVDKKKLRWSKKTKQIATVGPSCNTEEMLEKLFQAGADVFRLNFSHGTHDEKREIVAAIRRIEARYRHSISILADLQGPKLRIGEFDEEYVFLAQGQSFVLDLDVDTPGDETRVSMPHPEIFQVLGPGDVLLIDDGKLRLHVMSKSEDQKSVTCEVVVGGTVSARKGVNTPSVILPISPMTPKDRVDVKAAMDMGVDWVALSFVQKASDMSELREIVGDSVAIMAKIEKPSAVDQLDEIIELSDGIMVARGDLGVELMHEDVPILQRQIIDKCRTRGCPVVVATQMLESMISSPVPTRAEVNDVATALFLGTDAIMLSAESAAGQYPVESVAMQCSIINRVEGSDNFFPRMQSRAHPENVMPSGTAVLVPVKEYLAYDAITGAAMLLADNLKAAGMIVFTTTGGTAIRASRIRPSIPVIAMVQERWLGSRLALYWGIYPAFVNLDSGSANQSEQFDTLMARACSIAWDQGFAKNPSDLFIVTAGVPFGTKGAANVIRVLPAAGPEAWLLPNTEVEQEQRDWEV